MTNAEKYLKVSIKEFIEAIVGTETDIGGLYSLEKWLYKKAKPTLTEDERVILKNLHYEKGAYEYERIGRTRKDSEGYSDLYLIEKDLTITNFNEYIHLFQFIKERRRIRNKGVIR